MKKSLNFIGSIIFILLLFVILLSYAMFQGGFVSWFLFYSFLPIFGYQMGLIMYSMKRWKVERKLTHRTVEAGESVAVMLKVRRVFPFPLYYCVVEEIIPSSLMRKDNKHNKYDFMDRPVKLQFHRSIKNILFIGFKRNIEITYTLDELPRGEHELNRVRIFTSDVFGFIKKEHFFSVKDQLIVHPHNRELLLSEGSSIGQGSSAVNAFHFDNTNVLAGVREYTPGDRLSWIHWKQTAKNNTMMTKEFEQERNTDVLVILDTTNSERMNPLAFEAAVELVFSFMSRFDRANVKAGLLALGKETSHFPMNHDSFMKNKMKNYLIKVQPNGDIPFSLLLKEKMLTAGTADMNIILTYHVDGFFRQMIQEMKQRARVVVFYIQSSELITTKETTLISQMKNQGIAIHVLTEKELAETPLEVSIK